MFKTIPFISIACLGLTYLLANENTPEKKPGPAPTTQQLIDQLGDREHRVREAAGEALKARGTAVLADLRKAKGHPDKEVRRRLEEMIPTLERIEIFAPKLITLDAKGKTANQLIEDVCKQTGYKIRIQGGNDNQAFDLKVDQLPFWKAMDRIGEVSGLGLQQVYYNNNDDHLQLYYMGGPAAYVYYDGAFRSVANSFHYYRNIDFTHARGPAQANRNESLTFNFSVYSEPKLPLLGLGQVKLNEAYDEDKNSMIPSNRNNNNVEGKGYYRYGNGYRVFCLQSQVNLVRPNEKSKSVKYIKGSVPLTVLSEQKPGVVTNNLLKSKGKKTKLGTTNFTIEDVTEMPGKQYQIKLAVSDENKAAANDWTWTQSLQQRIEFQDDKGNKYQTWINQWGNSTPGNVQVTFMCTNNGNIANLGPPSKLIHYTWVTTQHELTFEFKDLPLP